MCKVSEYSRRGLDPLVSYPPSDLRQGVYEPEGIRQNVDSLGGAVDGETTHTRGPRVPRPREIGGRWFTSKTCTRRFEFKEHPF